MNPAQGIRSQEEILEALSEAALAISSNLALDKVLRQIVESSRKLVGAQYAALGVPNSEGLLVEFVHGGMEPSQVNSIGRLPRGKGLLGAILTGGKTIRLERLSDDARSAGFPQGHPHMESFLGVPIRAGEKVLGNLYLTNKKGERAFSAADKHAPR